MVRGAWWATFGFGGGARGKVGVRESLVMWEVVVGGCCWLVGVEIDVGDGGECVNVNGRGWRRGKRRWVGLGGHGRKLPDEC